MATKSDLKNFEDLMRLVIREETPIIIDEKIKYLPTKEEFYKEMDKLYTKMDKIEEEAVVEMSWKDQLEDHEEQIQIIKSHLKLSSKS
ncbi:MAG: hypothetical protein NUV98_00290 [Candidatus Roizmanbacteria bacterium]|nr:hypothetical protein [Candidatus Roizmanbacteria bacterium]